VTGRNAAIPVSEISDLPDPKRPLPPKGRQAPMWRTICHNGHRRSTRCTRWVSPNLAFTDPW